MAAIPISHVRDERIRHDAPRRRREGQQGFSCVDTKPLIGLRLNAIGPTVADGGEGRPMNGRGLMVSLNGKKLGVKTKISSVALLTAALVLGVGTAAHAEGSYTSSMTQVQPTFWSRSWTDNNRDSSHTIVKLTHCKVNLGGKNPGSTALKSVTLEFSNAEGYSKTVTHACGTYDFGRPPRAATYGSFFVQAINGQTQAGAKIFLNADVSVSY